MRFKNSIKDYETLEIKSSGHRNTNHDAIAAINLLNETNEIAFHLVGIGYSSKKNLSATFRTLPEAKNIAKSVVIDGEVYLVKNGCYEGFKSHFGNNRNTNKVHTPRCRITTAKVNPEIKSEVKIESAWRSNSSILKEIKSLFESAVEFTNLNLSNYKESRYYPLIESAITNNLHNQKDIINFKDYVDAIELDNTLNYIIQNIIRSSL